MSSDSLSPRLAARWGRARRLSVFEASYLLVGGDPNDGSRYGQGSLDYQQQQQREAIDDLLSREIGGRGINGAELSHDPKAILDACDLLGIEVPNVLRTEIIETRAKRIALEQQAERAASPPAHPAKDDNSTEGMSRRRYNTMLKLIGAMAADHYGWTPGTQGSAPADMENLTDEFGAKVSDDTIRKILAEAAEQIDVSSRFADDPS